ncbi:trichohyalin isoform X2 [Hetaerina americana]
MSRGRGYNMRGSYRGDGEGGSWGGRGSRGRGNNYTGSGRGRSNWYKENPTGFEQRGRYPSEGGGERYSGRGPVEDPSYRRYPRQEASGYSGREHGRRRSPDESPRKRMKTDHGYMQASSSRRSHEGSFSEYTRYSFEDKSYGEERRSYRDDRRSYREHSHGDHSGYSSRDEYSHRKERLEDRGESSMMEGRRPSLRGGYRGRSLDRGRLRRVIRGVPRVVLVRRTDGLLLKKSIMDHPYSVRKRIISARPQDYLKKLRTQKFRRLREAECEEEEEEEEKEEEIISDDEEKDGDEDTWDDIVKQVEDDDFDDFDDAAEDVKSVKEEKEETEKEGTSEKKEEGEEKPKEGEEEEEGEKEPAKKPEPEKVEKSSVQVTIKHDSDSRAVNEDELAHLIPKHFIRLHCPHCNVRCITYKEYGVHLFSSKHASTMRKLSLKHQSSLQRMRTQQRKNLLEEEEYEEEKGDVPIHPYSYCPICHLKYRASREKHQSTNLHRMLRKFLMPYCRICNMNFQSPMQYENHLCSVVHMQRKSKVDQRILRQKELDLEGEHEGGSGLDGEDKVLDMENFMILDSVGVVDETGDEAEGDSGQPKEKTDKTEKDERKRREVRLGVEYIKKVEVLFCELCRRYLPRHDQRERAIALHCTKGYHLDSYRNDKAMRREAERIHRKEMEKKKADDMKKATKKAENLAEKEAENSEKQNETQTDERKEKKADGTEENAKSSEEAGPMDTEAANDEPKQESGEGGEAEDLDSAIDDKLWADVDKDLGELLREVEPNSSAGATEGESLPVAEIEEDKSSDEDEEDSRAEDEERYDRFRYSEKGSAGSVVEEPNAENETTVTKAEVESEPVKEAPAEEESPESDLKKNEAETEEADV